MGHRRDVLDKRLKNATLTRQTNSIIKSRERDRRKSQMVTLLKEGSFPYTPTIMSWLSDQLGKKASRITPDDIKPLLA